MPLLRWLFFRGYIAILRRLSRLFSAHIFARAILLARFFLYRFLSFRFVLVSAVVFLVIFFLLVSFVTLRPPFWVRFGDFPITFLSY